MVKRLLENENGKRREREDLLGDGESGREEDRRKHTTSIRKSFQQFQ